MTHTHTKTYAVVSSHMLRRTARRKKDKLDRLTEQANRSGAGTPYETPRARFQRYAAETKLRELKLPLKGSYEDRKAPRGPWRWQVIVWS